MTTEMRWRWVLFASGAVGAYALGLVVAGPVAGSLFDTVGFGPGDGGVPDGPPSDYVVFIYAVLGSVVVGWMVMVAGVAAGPLRAGEPWARPLLVGSIGTWFVLDTAASLVLGFWTHAVFNLAFLAAMAPPLLRSPPRADRRRS